MLFFKKSKIFRRNIVLAKKHGKVPCNLQDVFPNPEKFRKIVFSFSIRRIVFLCVNLRKRERSMKIKLSERQKCVLVATATGVLISYPIFILISVLGNYGLLTDELYELFGKIYKHLFWVFLILNIMLGAVITKVKKKKHLFELWCASAIISALSLLCALVFYIMVSRNDRGKWSIVDFILIAVAVCIGCFNISIETPIIFIANLF